jgi:DNA-binding beta-propeller fold protein YncE
MNSRAKHNRASMVINNSFKLKLIVIVRRFLTSLGVALIGSLTLQVQTILAADQIMAVGIDRKFTYSEDTKKYIALAPDRDEVLFFNLADPANPRIIGSLPIANSIVGPPSNIVITSDQSMALIANALETSPVKGVTSWKMSASNFITVVDLTSDPIHIIGKVKVGNMPSGMSIDASGKMALVANRRDKTISVLSINGKSVKVTDTIKMNDVVTSVAISPNGRSAYATKFDKHSVAELNISSSGKVTYTGRDIPVGLYPWAITISSDGSKAMVTNIGKGSASDGNANTLSVLDLTAKPAVRVEQHVSIGDAPEGIAISPNGSFVAVTLLAGSFAVPIDAWYRKEVGQLSVLSNGEESISKLDNIQVGSFPEGIAFSADSSHIYVGNFASESLSVVELTSGGKIKSVREIKLPGPPGSLRVSGQ